MGREGEKWGGFRTNSVKTLHDLTLTSDAVYLTNIISLLVSSCIADQSALETGRARGFEVDGWGE